MHPEFRLAITRLWRVGRENFTGNVPLVSGLLPGFLVKDDAGGKILVPGDELEARSGGQGSKFPDLELADPDAAEAERTRMDDFLLRADDEILFQAGDIATAENMEHGGSSKIT